MLVLARFAEPSYRVLMQEDNLVEWATVGLFLLAGSLRVRATLAARRPFDGLVALFCLFVAGEEMSWGQRLVGYTPPPLFLEHNVQQELTLHNFAAIFGAPKWTLIAALAGYGLALPLAARVPLLRRAMAASGATAPAVPLVPWFAAAILLLVWYPVTFTGEWVELLAGALFTLAAWPHGVPFRGSAAALLASAAALTWASGRARGGAGQVACARAEAAALALDLATGAAPRLRDGRRLHKRVLTAAHDGQLDASRLHRFEAVACPLDSGHRTATRRRFAIDPWGTAYWIRAEPGAGILVYSFGPNRRRDGERGGDDVRERAGR